MRAAIEAVREAASLFRDYERGHLGQLSRIRPGEIHEREDREAKVARNRGAAEKLEAALVELESLYALGLLVEEMGEAQAIIGKALRFGLDSKAPPEYPGAGLSNRDLMELELGDVSAAQRWADLDGVIRLGAVDDRRDSKLNKLTIGNYRDGLGRLLAPPVRGRQEAVQEPQCAHLGRVERPGSHGLALICTACGAVGTVSHKAGNPAITWRLPDAQD